MQLEYTWVATSIFCSKTHWDRLLNEISLFHQKMSRSDTGSMIIQFNYQGGENIRWALWSPSAEADILARQISDYFSYFLSTVHVPDDSYSPPEEYIVPLLPANSIQYGLYVPAKCDGIQSALSWLMIEALADDDIDDETIVSFAFYLQVVLIKLMLNKGFISLKTLRSIYNTDGGYTSDVKYNYECIFQIAASINAAASDEVPAWLQKWMDLCERDISKELPYPLNNKYLLCYSRLIYHVHMHLGITVKMESILFSYLSLVLNSEIFEGSKTNI